MKTIIPLLLLACLCACKQPKDLVYRDVEHFSVKHADVKETVLSMDVRLFNPNKYKVRLKSADVDVFLNGKKLGKMKLGKRVTILKNETTSMPVVVNVDVGNSLLGMVQSVFGNDAVIKLTGNIRAGRFGMFINVPVNYESKQDVKSLMGGGLFK